MSAIDGKREIIKGLANFSPHEPYEFQKTTVYRAARRRLQRQRAGLAGATFAPLFAMGAGKTATAINIYRAWCIMEKRQLRCLIVCPNQVFEAWKREFESNAAERLWRSLTVVTGSPKKKEKTLNMPYSIFVVSTDTPSGKMWGKILAKNFDCIIVDEFHNFKSPQAGRTKGLLEVIGKIPFRIALTGTPITNNEQDLWSLLRFIAPEQTEVNNYAWLKRYFEDAMAAAKEKRKRDIAAGRLPKSAAIKWSKFTIREDKRAELYQLLDAHSRRITHEQALPHLPQLVRETIYVELHPDQKKLYRELEREWKTAMGEKTLKIRSILELLGRLNQICCGSVPMECVSHGPTKIYQEQRLRTKKIEVLEDILLQVTPTEKVIIWCPFLAPLNAVAELCNKMIPPVEWVRIDGSCNAKQKQTAIDSFNNDDSVRVCIANPAAGGTGIGLQAASYMVYYGRDYNWAKDAQSEKRAHRGGSEIHQKITRIDLVTQGTIEEDILHVLESKGNMADHLMRRDDNNTGINKSAN